MDNRGCRRPVRGGGQDSTQTAVACLTPEGRVEEIARMLGGVDLTEESLAHARKMVTKAQA